MSENSQPKRRQIYLKMGEEFDLIVDGNVTTFEGKKVRARVACNGVQVVDFYVSKASGGTAAQMTFESEEPMVTTETEVNEPIPYAITEAGRAALETK